MKWQILFWKYVCVFHFFKSVWKYKDQLSIHEFLWRELLRLEILNEWDCMYAWNNKREANHICFAVIWFAPPLFLLLASKGKHVPALWVRENEMGSHCGCISCGGEGGRTQIIWQQERFGIFLYYIPSWMSCAQSTYLVCLPTQLERKLQLYWWW